MATPEQIADSRAGRIFIENVLLDFKQRNVSEGMNFAQYMHMNRRFSSWVVNYPGRTDTINLASTITTGDVQSIAIALMYGVADDMTETYHWLSQARLNILIAECKTFLGWP